MSRLYANLNRFRFAGLLLFGFSILLGAGARMASAAGSDSDSELPTGSDLDYNLYGSMVQVIVVLTVIIGMIVLLIKFLSNKNKTLMASRTVKVLGGVALGQNKSLQLVEVGRSIYLVGVGENIQLLDKINDEEEISQIIESLNGRDQMNVKQVFPTLSQWISRIRKTGTKDAAEQQHQLTFQEVFQNKIKSISNRKQMVEQVWKEETRVDRSNENDK